MPYILQSTRIASHSKSFTDNVPSNIVIILDNFHHGFHFIRFLFYKSLAKKFIQANVLPNSFDKDWSNVLHLDQQEMNLSTESFLDNTNSILDEHEPLKLIDPMWTRNAIRRCALQSRVLGQGFLTYTKFKVFPTIWSTLNPANFHVMLFRKLSLSTDQ